MLFADAPARRVMLSLAAFAAGPSFSQSSPSLDPVVVTATRVAQASTRVLADVTVIDADVIARSGAVSLADLLVHVPGLEIVRNGGPAATTSLFLRGANTNHTVLMLDGIRLDTQSGSGGAAFQAIALQHIERIEILRGPAAAVYGSDAIAGVIQVFTRQGQGGLQPSVSVGTGSQGTRAAQAGLLGSHEGWRYAVSLGRERSDGYNVQPAGNPDRDGYARDAASLRLGREIAAGHQLEGSWVYTGTEAGYDSSTNPRNAGFAKDNRTHHQLNALGLSWNATWSPTWSSKLSVTSSRDRYQTQPDPSTAPDYDTRTELQTLLWNHTLRRGDAVWTAGVESRRDLLANTGTRPADTRRRQDALALGYGSQHQAHSWQVNARLDHDGDFGQFATGSLAYGYRLSPLWRVSASMGTAFRSPTLYQRYSEYGSADLKPEQAFNRELGLSYREGTQSVSVVGYHNRVSDLIAFGAAGACASSFGCYANTARATLQGVTVSGAARWLRTLWTASLDVQDPVDARTGKRLARRAGQLLKLGAETSWQGWDWNAQVLLSGDRFDNAANTTRLPGYGLLNVGATRSISRDTELLVRIDNVGDKAFETAKGFAQPGRTLWVGLKWSGR